MDKKVIDEELSLDDLELITGGAPRMRAEKSQAQMGRVACVFCGEICMVDLQKSSFTCPECHKKNTLAG